MELHGREYLKEILSNYTLFKEILNAIHQQLDVDSLSYYKNNLAVYARVFEEISSDMKYRSIFDTIEFNL